MINMEKEIMITIYTQVYNTKPYIRQCVESVLHQTYPHFEYYLVDNASTDGCKEILEEYAAADPRIRLLRNEKNAIPAPGAQICHQEGIGCYYTSLDADDWWKLDYLERMIQFAESNHLDIACTGAMMQVEGTEEKHFRKVKQPVAFSKNAFIEQLPAYHAFFRTLWGKLIRMEYLHSLPIDTVPSLFYGYDTAWCFQFLRRANRIGIDNSTLYNYRVRKKSLSYHYTPERFDCDIYLYNDAIDFLSPYGPVSQKNRQFLQAVYVNAVSDTIKVIDGSSFQAPNKLREYRTIATHSLTQTIYRECIYPEAAKSKKLLIQKALQAGAMLGKRDDEDFRAVMQAFSPRCGQAVFAANAQLFLKDSQLFQALFQDDPDRALQIFLNYMEINQGVKKYAVAKAIKALAAGNPLLCQIDDAVFLRNYASLYLKIWREEYLPALEDMTGLLLESQVGSGQETFLQLYISLSAVLEQVPAFLFGKLQLAQMYLRQNRLSECRTIVTDLEEMEMAENEELDEIRQKLEAAGC